MPYSSTRELGVGLLDRWCEANGIEHIMGRVGHPQTQGKIERTHGSAKRELCYFGLMDTLENARETIMRWIDFYNSERPHQALGYERPAERLMAKLGDRLPEFL